MKSLISFSVLLLFTISSHAQVYEVSSCEDLGLNPVEMVQDNEGNVMGNGTSIISIYLEGDPSTGLGGLGCWVHHHPNGKDYVVTPHGWTKTPGPVRMRLIREAMQAITDSRAKYSELGTMNMNLYYLFDDIHRSSELEEGGRSITQGDKFWLYDTDQCWMRSGVPTLRGLTPEQRKQVFAHEIGHCFNEENAPALTWRWDERDSWVDESVAEVLSSDVYKTTDYEHQYATDYDFDKPFYEQPYNTYVPFYYYTMLNGRESLVPLMTGIVNKETLEARIAYLKRIGFDRTFHEFLFDWTYNKIEDSGRHKTIPKTDEGFDELYELSESTEKIELDKKIQNGQREIYILSLPAGYDAILKPIAGSDQPFFQSLVLAGQKKLKFWESEIEIKGHCSRSLPIQLMVSHLNSSDLEGLNVEYELIAKEACCEADLIVEANPDENNLDGKFAFDYYIISEVKYSTDGETNSMPLNYFVNSKDGSMLLLQSWFTSAFGTYSSRDMEAHAIIWLPNGQVVAYVLDKNFGQKRAITLDLNQTKNQIMGIQAMKAAELVRMGPNSGVSPASLPYASPWEGYSSGIAINQPEMSNPSQINKISAYISNDEYPISSPLPSFGFLVGYIRDANNLNKKMVYNKVELPGGDMYEAHLIFMTNACAQFDGTGYKKMTIGSSTGAIGAMTVDEREAFAESQNDMHVQMMMMLKDLERCRGDAQCEAEVQKRMMELERQIQNAVFDLAENPENRGNAASEFQQEQRAIRDDMHQLQETILDQEVKCDRLRRLGGARLAVESCETTLEAYKNRMHQLNCKLARLQGVSDMFEDCPRY